MAGLKGGISMPIRKRYLLDGALVTSFLAVLVVFIGPAQYKVVILLGLYLILLLLGLAYYKSYHHALDEIKALDQDENYEQLLRYLDQVEQKGYGGFVYDSYRIYAQYVLGDFSDYRQSAKRMQKTRAWKRPKFQSFREKVKENLCCLDFLESWAKTGQINYQGNNVVMLQSIADYQSGQYQAVIDRLHHYQDESKLRTACLYALGHQFEALDGLYERAEAKTILAEIKGREIHD